jgi:hypothetical protein
VYFVWNKLDRLVLPASQMYSGPSTSHSQLRLHGFVPLKSQYLDAAILLTRRIQVNLGRSSFEASEVRGKPDSRNVLGRVLNVVPPRLATVRDKCFPSGGSDSQNVSLTLFHSSFESMNGFSA